MDYTLSLLLIAVGFAAGLFGSALGLGGGVFVVPILTLLLHIPIHTAIGTSIVAVIATSSSAANVYVKARLVNIRLGILLEIATTTGAIIGGLTAVLVDAHILSVLFGLVQVYVAYAMGIRSAVSEESLAEEGPPAGVEEIGFLGTALSASYYDRATEQVIRYQAKSVPLGLLASVLAGNLSGLLGIGGGIIKVPTMNLLMGIPLKAATATSNFTIGVTAVASAFIYYSRGHIHPFIIAPVVVGVFLGAQAGSRLAQKARNVTLRRIFMLVPLFIGLQMLLKGFNLNLGF
ncbi:MAG: sulfite exporter TauE/SafE family protein [Chloroflexi bacterium]|nr:sulfite exporter TauE/SafE family protein [Chloroflexota bacterium]